MSQKDLFIHPEQKQPLLDLAEYLGESLEDIFTIKERNINAFKSPLREVYDCSGRSFLIIEDGNVIGISFSGAGEMGAILYYDDPEEEATDDSRIKKINRYMADYPKWLSPLSKLMFLEMHSLMQDSVNISFHPYLTYFQHRDDHVKEIICTKEQSEFFEEDFGESNVTVKGSHPASLVSILKQHIDILEYEIGDEWDSFDPQEALKIVSKETCDLGTALHIYWYFLPYYYFSKKVAEDLKNGEYVIYDDQPIKLLEAIEKNVLNNVYKTAIIPFDPDNDSPAWNSYDKSEGELVKEIPTEMLQVVKAGYLEMMK